MYVYICTPIHIHAYVYTIPSYAILFPIRSYPKFAGEAARRASPRSQRIKDDNNT